MTRARWDGDEDTGPLWLERYTGDPDPGPKWKTIARIAWNKSRTLFTVWQPGEGGMRLAERRTLDAAKESALAMLGDDFTVAPLGAPCPHCRANRRQQEDGITWACENSLCVRRRAAGRTA